MRKNEKAIIGEKNKSAIAVTLSTAIVIVVALILGIGTTIMSKENANDKFSSKETATTSTVVRSADTKKATEKPSEKAKKEKSTEKPTEKPTDKKYTLKFQKDKIALKNGEVYSVEFADGVKKEKLKLEWTSDNKEVLTVDKKGNITALAEGKAVVTCIDKTDGEKLKLSVTVTEPVYPDSIELDQTSYTLTNIGQQLKLNATITPKETVTEKKLKWVSDDLSVITVDDNGLVTAVGEGFGIVTCLTENEYYAQCEITVQTVVKAEEIYLDYEGYDFDGPQTEPVQLTATVYPENTTVSEVSWHSTDENVAKVNETGAITVVGDGECKIVCTTTDGTYLSAECEITSVNSMAVSLSPSESVYVPVNPIPADTPFEEALRYVGVIPYVWGGTDLATGVDCSGFLCAVYDRFGVNLWGVRTDLYLAGTEVESIEEAKAGDILCYSGHVAMYDGNGGRVHAYDEGYMVMRDTNIDGYYTIRRVME